MSMNKTDMAKKIMDDMKTITDITPSKAMEQMSKSIKEYIETNCELSYVWVGNTVPPTSPDPATPMTSKVNFASFSLSVANLPSADLAIASLMVSININILTALLVPDDVTFLMGPPIVTPLITLTVSGKTNTTEALEYFSDEIISGLKLSFSPVVAGTHAAFVGATTGVTVS